MGVASGCGEQEVGVASGSGWNLWVWLLGVVVRRYIDFLSLLLLYLFFFTAESTLFVHKIFFFCSCIYIYICYAQSTDSDHPRICCANLGSELCAIILGLRTQTSDPRICCTNLGSADFAAQTLDPHVIF